MIELLRVPGGGYTALDGRFTIQRNGESRKRSYCAPARWWTITDTTNNFEAYADTLKHARDWIKRLEAIEREIEQEKRQRA